MSKNDKVLLQCREIVKDLLPGKNDGFRDDDDVFMLGLDSIRIVTLIAGLQELFGIQFDADEISVGYFRTVGTITNLVKKKIAAGGKPEKEPTLQCETMVALKPKGRKKPFFGVPSLGRSPFLFSNFIPHFDRDRPFWGIRPLGLHGEAEPHTSIEDMAAFYISAMNKQGFDGPYLLGGMCFGSLVAFEMARQLEMEDKIVAKLVVFDELLPPGSPEFRPQKSKHGVRHLYPYLDKLEAVHLKARSRYSPGIYRGDMTFFHTTEYNTANEILAGWSSLVAGEVDVQEIPGVHGGGDVPGVSFLNEPHIATLTHKLNACLDSAEKV